MPDISPPERSSTSDYTARAVAVMMFEWKGTRRSALVWSCLLILALIQLSFYHQFGAVCCVAGFLIARMVCGIAEPDPRFRRVERWAPVVLCLVLALLLSCNQWRGRHSIPVSGFSARVATYLAAVAQPTAMLLGPPDTINLQAETRHPVFANADTPYLIAYIPRLGPAIEKMYHDVYGVSFVIPPTHGAAPWQEVWTARTEDRWQVLREEYGFQYVIAPESLHLDLPLLFREGPRKLYQIPNSMHDR